MVPCVPCLDGILKISNNLCTVWLKKLFFFMWTTLSYKALKRSMSLPLWLFLIHGKEESCWVCIIFSHLHRFWQWRVLSEVRGTKAGLSCVFTEHWWLPASLFSLCFFPCIKLPIFHFRWGCEAVLRCLFLSHDCHLWSSYISDRFLNCPRVFVGQCAEWSVTSLGLSLWL